MSVVNQSIVEKVLPNLANDRTCGNICIKFLKVASIDSIAISAQFIQLAGPDFNGFSHLDFVLHSIAGPVLRQLTISSQLWNILASLMVRVIDGDATIRIKYQIRTKNKFGSKTNSAQIFNYLQFVIFSSVYKILNNCRSS